MTSQIKERTQQPQDGQGKLSLGRLKEEAGSLVSALGDRALHSMLGKVEGSASRLTEYVESGAGPGLMAALKGGSELAKGKSPGRAVLGAGMSAAKGAVGGLLGRKGGGGGQGRNLKVTNIVESIDVGVPVRLAYDQWTQFTDFPSFMKKVENVEQESDEKLNWKAQVFWSHRTWEAEITKQVPDQKIVWTSKGAKGHVDGAVTFHELGPELSRILVVLEYHPQGLFEHTGNIWRAQGRRVRLELKHFRRQLMTQAILHPEEIEGWRGVIEDGEVVKDHQTAVQEEQGQPEDSAEGEEYEDEYADEYEEPEASEESEDYDEEEEEEDDSSREPEPERARAREGARR